MTKKEASKILLSLLRRRMTYEDFVSIKGVFRQNKTKFLSSPYWRRFSRRHIQFIALHESLMKALGRERSKKTMNEAYQTFLSKTLEQGVRQYDQEGNDRVAREIADSLKGRR